MAAFAFSPIHNITTKSLCMAKPGEVQGGLLSRLFNKIKALLGKNKKKPAVKEQEAVENSEEEKEKGD